MAWAPFFSGAERALLVLLSQLDRARFRPVVALGVDGELARAIRQLGIETAIVPIAYADRRHPLAWAQSVARLVRLALRTRAALVHANDAPSFQPAGYAARLLSRPSITHIRFPDTLDGFRWFLRPGFDRALFVSQGLIDDLAADARAFFASRAQVVHDGVDIPPLANDETRQALRHELGLSAARPVVVIAGQVAEIKGIWDYLTAAELLVTRGVDVDFAVLGDDLKNRGALRVEAEAWVRARGLESRVRFLGFRPNAPRLIPAFDIVAVPSHIEPLGNATLEAMATARPVVGSRVGGIPEMIVDGVTGLLVEPRAPQVLARALETLIHDKAKAAAMGAAGRQRALDHFSIPAHVAHIQSVYERVLQHTTDPRTMTSTAKGAAK